MDVEGLAVAKIASMLARCPHLKAYVSTNDKTPFTDGYVDVYDGLRQSKPAWRGRVPLQVKGRTRRSKKSISIAHPIPRVDLLGYQKDSGVLYFVVIVDSQSGRGTPYYANLSPFAIDWILSGVSADQQEVSVTLKPLPNVANEIESIVSLALKNREQSLTLGFDPSLFEDAIDLTIFSATNLDLDAPLTLTPGDHDFALLLNTKGGMSIPVGGEIRIFPQESAPEHLDITIGSGAVIYDGGLAKRVNDKTLEIQIADGLRLGFRNDSGGQAANVSLTLESSLSGRLKSIEFYIALLDTGMIAINGSSSRFEIANSDEDDDLRLHLAALRALRDLCERLGVNTDLIDLDQVDDTQVQQLRVLHRAFVLNEEITDPALEVSRVVQQFGQWSLMFIIIEGSTPGTWRFIDPFSTDPRQQFQIAPKDEDGKPTGGDATLVTAYEVVEDEHLATTVNMRLESIVDAYQSIADLPRTLGLASHRMLMLITASDRSNELRRRELLDAADRLNDWLIVKGGEKETHFINRWQIAARRGPLTAEQRTEIRGLRRQIARTTLDNADQLELACALLLGDADEVGDLTKQLPERRLKEMQGWPIWQLRDAAAWVSG